MCVDNRTHIITGYTGYQFQVIPKRSAVKQNHLLTLLLLLSVLSSCATAVRETGFVRNEWSTQGDPSSRAKEFMENVYSGKTMQVEDWIAADTRSSRLFNIYGGIDALVKNNYAEALRNQGFKSVNVLNVNKQQHNGYTVNLIVIFNNGVVSNCHETWVLEDRKWKITFNSNGN
jgi:hypothetical protein